MTRRRGRTLAEASPAVGRLLEQAHARSAGAVTSSATVSSPARHCWVDLPDFPAWCAGVLLGWRRNQDGEWAGWVAYVVDDDDQAVKVSAWVPAEHLHPA